LLHSGDFSTTFEFQREKSDVRDMKCSAQGYGFWGLWAMLLPILGFSQHPVPCFPIWQGFSQQWGYNHGIGRLGDWVENVSEGDSCAILCSHAAATGKGADGANFTQYYARIHSDLVQTQSGVATFDLTGKEGAYIAEVQTAEADFLEAEDSHTQYTVVLNGFDLRTADDAMPDNFQELDIEIDSVWRDTAAAKVHFRMRVALRFACKGVECEPLNQVVDYRLKLYWLALGGHGFHSQTATFGSGRAWEKNDTTVMAPFPRVALLGDAHYPLATAAITGLHMQLDDAHHMLGWESSLQAGHYGQGLLMTQMGMTFVQNSPTMRATYKERRAAHGHPPAKSAIKPKSGNLAWEMDVTLLQFEDAEIVPERNSGTITLDPFRRRPEFEGNEADPSLVEIHR
jgi:hypothetical protein